jgi:hypothetical protein
MPTKFQKIYEDWAQFDQAITRFKNGIKEGHRQTYNLSIWMESDKPAEKHRCMHARLGGRAPKMERL